jgi:hypothetical protein
MNFEEKILESLTSLESRIVNFEKDVNTRFDNFEKDVNTRFDIIDTDIADIKHSITLIEAEHGKKLDAVFDSYKLLYDITGEIRGDIDKLKSTQDKHDLILRWLDAEKLKAM